MEKTHRIQIAESEADVRRCYPVMAQLRPHLTEAKFFEAVRLQTREDRFNLVFVEHTGEVRAVAGFRCGHCLAWGKFLYVDDLVTDSHQRSMGFGGILLDWLIAHAKSLGCDQFHLDSGVQRFDAHRFYLTKRMSITAHHFSFILIPRPA